MQPILQGVRMHVDRSVAGIEIIDLRTDLAAGSLKACRAKFAESLRREAIERLFLEIEDGSLPLGDWRNGEIQIVGIETIVSNRYWSEIVYRVLFPPRAGNVPAEGTYRNIVWNAGVTAGAAAFPITSDGRIILVRSFRHAARRWTIELARGVKLPGENVVDCAIREAREECGVILTEDSRTINLGVHDPDTGVLRQEVPIIGITTVEVDAAGTSRDVSESLLGPVILTVREFTEHLRDGRITDGWAASAFGRAIVHGLIRL